MARSNPLRPFTPDPAQMALKPALSGNRINGLGEAQPRAPRMVYWAPDPDTIPHGAMQRWFYQVDPDNADLARAREQRARLLAQEIPPRQGDPVQRDPQQWASALTEFFASADVSMVGVTRMDPSWVYEGQRVTRSHIIMLGFSHVYAQLATAPAATAGAEVVRQYGRAAAGAKAVAGWLHLLGWDAQALTGPMTSAVTLIPPAIACGFGELGKHGSLVNPEYGSAFRLAAVLTDAPLPTTSARSFGVDAFCHHCRVCEDACPTEAIGAHKQLVRGTEKWYVDFDRCLPFFNQTHGCAICIAVCPWSRPGVGLNLAAKLAQRKQRPPSH